jgi:hypothetical protein
MLLVGTVFPYSHPLNNMSSTDDSSQRPSFPDTFESPRMSLPRILVIEVMDLVTRVERLDHSYSV